MAVLGLKETKRLSRGRPARAEKPSTETVCIRITLAERRVLEAAASVNGLTLSEFLRDLAVTEAGDLLEK